MHFLRAACVGLLTAAVSADEVVRFMPLGDSITELTCWRTYVWDQFVDEGLGDRVNFVGSKNNEHKECVSQAGNFDTDHEGHRGWLAVDIANDYLEAWLEEAKPDIVQFMLGTNDIQKGKTTDEIIDAYTKMVRLMRKSNPRMKIIVDMLLPHKRNQNATDSLNRRIPGWAFLLSTIRSPIQVVDLSVTGGFNLDLTYDGIHPNEEGDHFIAQRLGPVLIEAAEDILDERS